MKGTKVIISKKKPEEFSGELLVTFVTRDKDGKVKGDKLFELFLTSLQEFKEFTGKKEEFLQLYPPFSQTEGALKCKRVLLVGLGEIGELSDSDDKNELLRTAGGTIARQCKKNHAATVGILVPEIEGLKKSVVGEYITEGILLGGYQFLKYRKPDDEAYPGLKKVAFLQAVAYPGMRKSIDRGSNSATAACVARDMANEPGNGWTPAHFAGYARKTAKRLGMKCTVLEKSHMVKLGMGGIIAVNKGSEEPPKLVILDYNPASKADTVLLVGKGLTFDTGGVSLKPAAGMMDMKYDMCGGAAVLSAMEAVATEKLEVRVIAIVPSTDNMSGGGAVKPGDIITHYGGTTSEIENTDAEGRLILADALAYGIEKYEPDCVIDLATLTGAVIFALGHHYSGLMSNSDLLSQKLVEAGKGCGEPLWRLPLGDMYAKQIKSTVADIKNTGGKPAGSITAAEYLHKFVGEVPWAHLDIAGTAWDFTEKTYIPKGPSGFGVRTLVEMIRRWESGFSKKNETK